MCLHLVNLGMLVSITFLAMECVMMTLIIQRLVFPCNTPRNNVPKSHTNGRADISPFGMGVDAKKESACDIISLAAMQCITLQPQLCSVPRRAPQRCTSDGGNQLKCGGESCSEHVALAYNLAVTLDLRRLRVLLSQCHSS